MKGLSYTNRFLKHALRLLLTIFAATGLKLSTVQAMEFEARLAWSHSQANQLLFTDNNGGRTSGSTNGDAISLHASGWETFANLGLEYEEEKFTASNQHGTYKSYNIVVDKTWELWDHLYLGPVGKVSVYQTVNYSMDPTLGVQDFWATYQGGYSLGARLGYRWRFLSPFAEVHWRHLKFGHIYRNGNLDDTNPNDNPTLTAWVYRLGLSFYF